MLAVSSRAAAQDICTQYPDLPQCDGGGGPGGGGGGGGGNGPGSGNGGDNGGGNGPGGGGGGGGGNGPGSGNGGDSGGGSGGPGSGTGGDSAGEQVGVSDTSGGQLPYTGYPLTSGIIFALLLVGGGLALRGGLAINERRRDAAPDSDTPAGLS